MTPTTAAPGRALDIEEVHGDEMTVNLGPQHPSTHGVLRVLLKTDGEIVREAIPYIGYLHRCFEKHAENVDYPGVIPYADRMDYVASMANSLGFCLAVEKLSGIEVGPRTTTIRVLINELQRIASHLLSIGTYGMDIGAFTPFLHCFRDRETVLDLFEELCGARLLYNYNWVGGVSHDLPEGFEARCRKFIEYFDPTIQEYDDLLSFNKIFVERTATVGILPADVAIHYGITGPNLRGSGVRWDLRKDEPYCAYETYDFDIPVGAGRFGPLGSCWDRYFVRVEEMRQSCRIIRQALDRLEKFRADGVEESVHAKVPKRVKPPAGEIFHRTETPRGELGYYIVSDGGVNPYRVKVKSPCFTVMSAFHLMARGHFIADIIAIIGSVDIVLGELDR